MKIALIGYGRMGKTIEQLAIEAGHEIVLKTNDLTQDTEALLTSEVAIEFTTPAVAVANITTCLELGIPVVSGTTGWLAKGDSPSEIYGEVANAVSNNNGSFFYSSNFSLGVNIFFKLNQYLAKLMRSLEGYDAHLAEIHHIHKLDAPSGTAITIASDLLQQHPNYQDWQLTGEHWPNHAKGNSLAEIERNKAAILAAGQKLPLTSFREGETPGTHRITYSSEVDDIQIEHKAHGRIGFAKGALTAALWLPGKKGILSMDDLLNL